MILRFAIVVRTSYLSILFCLQWYGRWPWAAWARRREPAGLQGPAALLGRSPHGGGQEAPWRPLGCQAARGAMRWHGARAACRHALSCRAGRSGAHGLPSPDSRAGPRVGPQAGLGRLGAGRGRRLPGAMPAHCPPGAAACPRVSRRPGQARRALPWPRVCRARHRVWSLSGPAGARVCRPRLRPL